MKHYLKSAFAAASDIAHEYKIMLTTNPFKQQLGQGDAVALGYAFAGIAAGATLAGFPFLGMMMGGLAAGAFVGLAGFAVENCELRKAEPSNSVGMKPGN